MSAARFFKLLVIIAGSFAALSCGSIPSEQIIGRWMSVDGCQNLEFGEIGSVLFSSGYTGWAIAANYKFVADHQILMDFDGFGAISGPVAVAVSVTDQQLTLETGSQSSSYRRRAAAESRDNPIRVLPRSVLALRVDLPSDAEPYAAEQLQALYEVLVERVRAVPTVTDVGVMSQLPVSCDETRQEVVLEGGLGPIEADVSVITSGAFRALEVPVIVGRLFWEYARWRTFDPSVGEAIVDEITAQRLWPNDNPIGKQLKIRDSSRGDDPALRIVGVVRANIQSAEPKPHIYLSLAGLTSAKTTVVIGTQTPANIVDIVRNEIAGLDRRLIVSDADPLSNQD